MSYHNILSNPTLQTSSDNLHMETIHVLDYPPQYIYHPIQWQTTVTPTVRGEYRKRTEDLHIIPTVWPQTVNGNRVLTIEANTKHFVTKLEQLQIPLKAHQRYLVKVAFTPAVQPMGEVAPSDLAWRLTVSQKGAEYTDGFQSVAAIGEWGTSRSALLVVHSYAEQLVHLAVEFWSKFGNLDKQIYIHSIEMLEVESTYGDTGSVHTIGTASTDPPDDDPAPIPDDTPTPTAEPWMLWGALALCGVVIGAILYAILAPRMAAQGVQMEDVLNQLFAIPVFATVTYTSGIVYFLVELLKRVKGKYVPAGKLTWLTPEFSAIVLIVFFLGAHGLAVEYAYDNALKQVAQFFTDLVAVMGPYVLAMIGTQVVTSAGYQAARKRRVVGFNFGQ